MHLKFILKSKKNKDYCILYESINYHLASLSHIILVLHQFYAYLLFF